MCCPDIINSLKSNKRQQLIAQEIVKNTGKAHLQKFIFYIQKKKKRIIRKFCVFAFWAMDDRTIIIDNKLGE